MGKIFVDRNKHVLEKINSKFHVVGPILDQPEPEHADISKNLTKFLTLHFRLLERLQDIDHVFR